MVLKILPGGALKAVSRYSESMDNPSISFFVRVDVVEEADRVFSLLVDGGEASMPLGS